MLISRGKSTKAAAKLLISDWRPVSCVKRKQHRLQRIDVLGCAEFFVLARNLARLNNLPAVRVRRIFHQWWHFSHRHRMYDGEQQRRFWRRLESEHSLALRHFLPRWLDISILVAFDASMKATVQFDRSRYITFSIYRGNTHHCVPVHTLFDICLSTLLAYAFPEKDRITLHTRSSGRLFNLSRPCAKTRPVISLRHQGWRRVFWEGPKFFKLCPIVFNYAQQIFPGGGEKVCRGLRPPWLRAWRKLTPAANVFVNCSAQTTLLWSLILDAPASKSLRSFFSDLGWLWHDHHFAEYHRNFTRSIPTAAHFHQRFTA